jgi:hypothetical protein
MTLFIPDDVRAIKNRAKYYRHGDNAGKDELLVVFYAGHGGRVGGAKAGADYE